MSPPPAELGRQRVICWAWSGATPFGILPSASRLLDNAHYIHGMAVCGSEDDGVVYLFFCDSRWTTISDNMYDSAADAVADIPDQFSAVEPQWTYT